MAEAIDIPNHWLPEHKQSQREDYRNAADIIHLIEQHEEKLALKQAKENAQIERENRKALYAKQIQDGQEIQFCEAQEAAIDMGYMRLYSLLVEQGIFDPIDPDDVLEYEWSKQ